MKIKLMFIILILLFLIPSINAITYNVSESGHATFSESTTGNESTFSHGSLVDTNKNINAICHDYDTYPIPLKDTIYFYTIDGSGYNWNLQYWNGDSWNTVNGADPSYSCSFTLTYNGYRLVNGSFSFWAQPDVGIGRYKAVVTYDSSTYNETLKNSISGTNCLSINYDSPDCKFRTHYAKYNSGCGHPASLVINSNHELPKYAESVTDYQTGQVSDYWNYEYYYNSSSGVEKAWFNVSKEGTQTKWNKLYYKSILEGETKVYNFNPETSFNTDTLNQTWTGYAINITVNYTTQNSDLINLTQPYGDDEAPSCNGENTVYVYFVDNDGVSISDDVNITYYFDCNGVNTTYNWNHQTNSYMIINNVTDNTTIYYYAKTDSGNYFSPTEIYNTTGEIYVGNPSNNEVNQYITFYSTNEDMNQVVSDPTNETWIDFYIQDSFTYQVLNDVKIRLNNTDNTTKYTNDNGFVRFIVDKNTSYRAYISRDDYYSQTFDFNISSDYDKLINLIKKASAKSSIQWQYKSLKQENTVYLDSDINIKIDLETLNYANKESKYVDYENDKSSQNPITHTNFYLRFIKNDNVIDEWKFDLDEHHSLIDSVFHPTYAYKDTIQTYNNQDNWDLDSEYKVMLISYDIIEKQEYIEYVKIIEIENDTKENLTLSDDEYTSFSGQEIQNDLINMFTTKPFMAFLFSLVVGVMISKAGKGTKGNKELGLIGFTSMIIFFSLYGWLPKTVMFILVLFGILAFANLIKEKIFSGG